MHTLIDSPSWSVLKGLYAQTKDRHLRDQFTQDPGRFERYSLRLESILFDYSKHRIDDTILQALTELAREVGLHEMRDQFFSGAQINTTEKRSVFHMALRNRSDETMTIDGEDVMPMVRGELDHMRQFVEQIHTGRWTGYTGQPITDVVNIGIGGSDLGPAMVYEALWAYHHPGLSVRFVSNVDGTQLHRTLSGLNPRPRCSSLHPRLYHGRDINQCSQCANLVLDSGATTDDVARHFVALSTNRDAVVEFGIDPENMFQFWDWVGGRFLFGRSLAYPLPLGLGWIILRPFWGGHRMDQHFRDAPFDENIPVIMAVLGLWYTNFYGCQAHGVLPYDQGARSISGVFATG